MTRWRLKTQKEKEAVYAKQRAYDLRTGTTRHSRRTNEQKTQESKRKKAWYQSNRTRVLMRTAAYHKAHPDVSRRAIKKYAAANKVRYQYWNRRQKLYTKYGVTVRQYDIMLATQNGACAVCLYKPSPTAKRLAVDHDHATGRVRGLLCWWCNRNLLAKRVTSEALRRAAAYLESVFDGRSL